MNVLIDAHMIGGRETGNETYAANLLRQWPVFEACGVQLHALMPASGAHLNDFNRAVIVSGATGNLHRFFRDIPRALALTKAQVLHVTYHAPFWMSIPYIVTIHDVSYRTHPCHHSARNVLLQNVLGYLTARRAAAVITVSDFCRREIVRIYPFLADRIFVTPEAADARWTPQPADAVRAVREALGITGSFLLWVGKFQRRKNLDRIVEAFLQVSAVRPDCQLVLAGDHATPIGRALRRRAAEPIAQGKIILSGHVSEQTLACLYTGCVAFLFPSLYEGFGLPVLEAMQCGAPVITSNTTALPEVAGDAALLVNPMSTQEIANAIRIALADPVLLRHLSMAGIAHARNFSWSSTAKQTADIYHVCAARHPVLYS